MLQLSIILLNSSFSGLPICKIKKIPEGARLGILQIIYGYDTAAI